MKKMIPKISLTLALILILAAFSGCGRGPSRNMSAAVPQASPAPAASANHTTHTLSNSGETLGIGESATLYEAFGDFDASEPRALGEEAGGWFQPEAQKWNLLVASDAETLAALESEAQKSDLLVSSDAEILAVSEAEPDTGGGVAGPVVKPVVDARKIIKNVDLMLQTLTFDSGVESIPKIAESFGGYVQDSYVNGRDMYNDRGTRYATFTVRIPVERLDSFLDSVGGEFHITRKSQNSQDITDSYYDSKARLDALKIQEERLLEMLKQAAELEYLLQVEKELMNVRYEIESLTASLNRMDSFVSMSTVTIDLQEVVKYDPVEDKPVTFGERISRAFSESWENFGESSQDFVVWFVEAFPSLLLLAVIALVIIMCIRASIKRGKAKKAENDAVPPKQAATAEQPTAKEKKKQ